MKNHFLGECHRINRRHCKLIFIICHPVRCVVRTGISVREFHVMWCVNIDIRLFILHKID